MNSIDRYNFHSPLPLFFTDIVEIHHFKDTLTLTFIIMKAPLVFFGLLVFSISCNVSRSDERHFEINQTLKSGKHFFVQDSSQYSPEFISQLRTFDGTYGSVRLIGKYLIMNDTDTCSIPTELPINETVYYQATKSDTAYSLGLKRINYTNIDYDFSINDKLVKSGQIMLPADLCLGFESTDENGESFLMTQYFDKKETWTCIKIEIENANRVSFFMISDIDSTMSFKNVPLLKRK